MAKTTKQETENQTDAFTAPITEEEYFNQPVTVKLFKDNDKYKDNVFVAVNGVGMIVPRGKEVQIPRKYAIALKNSEAQDSFAAEYAAQLSKNSGSFELNE